MEFISLVIAIPAAILGGIWLFDFFQWFSRGQVLIARIESFQDKKDKGFPLPVVSIESATGGARLLRPERIDQIIYMLSRPKEGDYTTVIVLSGDEDSDNDNQSRARIFGYGYVVAGIFCFLLLLMSLSLIFDNSLAFAQVMYMSIFTAILAGGWIILKLIQSSDEA